MRRSAPLGEEGAAMSLALEQEMDRLEPERKGQGVRAEALGDLRWLSLDRSPDLATRHPEAPGRKWPWPEGVGD